MQLQGGLITLTLTLLAIIGGVLATEAGRTEYIMVFREPVTNETFTQARSDVKSVHGNITHEYHTVLQGIAALLPDDGVQVLEQKSYIGYIEKSGEVHTMSGA